MRIHIGDQYCLRFTEKGGKSREIPVRHDLQQFIAEYIAAAKLGYSDKSTPLFRSVIRRTKQMTMNGMTPGDIGRMVKRPLKDAGLPSILSPHSFRAGTITDLLSQGVPLEDVQNLVGHADPRTTRLYDRRKKEGGAEYCGADLDLRQVRIPTAQILGQRRRSIATDTNLVPALDNASQRLTNWHL